MKLIHSLFFYDHAFRNFTNYLVLWVDSFTITTGRVKVICLKGHMGLWCIAAKPIRGYLDLCAILAYMCLRALAKRNEWF